VELHGGTIRAQSEGDGQGATFVVTLPFLASQAAAKHVAPERRRAEVSAGADARSELAGLKVLVVDDELDTRELLFTILSNCDAEVKLAASAEEALAVLPEWRPDVLISDIQMPNVDGYSLIRQLRALELGRGGQIPAVALTAYARVEDRLRALEAGFQIHLSKPVEPVELATVVASLTGRIGKGKRRESASEGSKTAKQTAGAFCESKATH
jgi:CheY-like chemotaxis protein